MKRYLQLIGLIITIGVGYTGCSLKPSFKPIHYYALDYPSKQFQSQQLCRPDQKNIFPCTLPVVIRFERFKAAPMYESNGMVYRRGDYRADTYVYHKWRAVPADMVTYFLARDFRESSLFKGVFTSSQHLHATHRIEGIVEQFFEQDDEPIWKAVLSINIILLSENEPDISQRIIFQKQYQADMPCIHHSPDGFVDAMSRAMASVSEQIVRDVYQYLTTAIMIDIDFLSGTKSLGSDPTAQRKKNDED